MNKLLFWLLLLIFSGVLSANQDAAFLAARDAYIAGKYDLLPTYAKKLNNHVLAPYVEYYQLRSNIYKTDTAQILAFLNQYQNTSMAENLRKTWLKVLGHKEKWDLFAEEYSKVVHTDTELVCLTHRQRIHENKPNALANARHIWFTGYSMPKGCTPLFKKLISSGQISNQDIWARIRLALDASQIGVARHLNQHLPRKQRLSTAKLRSAKRSAKRYLKKHRKALQTRASREVYLYALMRLLRVDTDKAYAHWKKVHNRFNSTDQSYFTGQLAYYAALRHDPRALDWFKKATKTSKPYPLTDKLIAWKTRAALRAQNWDIVLHSINEMSATAQQTNTWRYWKARALKEKGQLSIANTLFAHIIREQDFYGLLAQEELGVTLNLPKDTHKVSQQEIDNILKNQSIQRALTFFRLELRTEGIREWAWAIRELNDNQLLAAAEMAYRHGLYDRAIHAANKTQSKHNFNLRFLTPHRNKMLNVLQQNELDEALVYGLIRQESRFIADIKSHAGAMGLMQLMPSTAKWVAKELGIQNYRKKHATEVDLNLKLGTYYLKHVLIELDNQPLLATAAYNAGPGRAKRWLNTSPLEGAIYAETIPYNETRDYVKKVFNNTMYYAAVLEKNQNMPTLKERLGIVN